MLNPNSSWSVLNHGKSKQKQTSQPLSSFGGEGFAPLSLDFVACYNTSVQFIWRQRPQISKLPYLYENWANSVTVMVKSTPILNPRTRFECFIEMYLLINIRTTHSRNNYWPTFFRFGENFLFLNSFGNFKPNCNFQAHLIQ